VPAPPLSAADQLKTFILSPGFRIELVADESLVRDPVAAAFDLKGNLMVAEITRFHVGMIRDVPKLAAGVLSVASSAITTHYRRCSLSGFISGPSPRSSSLPNKSHPNTWHD